MKDATEEAAQAAEATAADWYRDAVIYQVHVKAYQDSNGDGVGDFAGLMRRLDHVQELGATAVWLLPFYPSPLRDDGYDIGEYKAVNPSYGTLGGLPGLRGRGAPAGPQGHHRAGHQPHLRPARVVPARAPRAEGQPRARLLRLVGRRRQVARDAHHLHRHRALELVVGPGGRAVLLAPLLQPPARSELRQPRRDGGGARRHALLARHGGGRPAGSTPSPTSSSATAPTTRTSPRRTRS